MKPTANLPLSDRALQDGEPDLLERGPFVRNLATILCNAPKRDSVVFALYGRWGEGKTSTLTLLDAELAARKENCEPAPVVIRFNPWVFSGREHLFNAFFEDIGNAIGESPDPNRAEAAKRWKRLGAYSHLAGTAVGGINSVLGFVGASIPCGEIISGLLKKAGEVTGSAAEIDGNAQAKSLQDLRREMEETLTKLPQSLLVILDDLDRLPPNELVEIFQLLKSTVDLPNVHYLLLCDRGNIERNLKMQGLRPDYLEKIVQFGASLPAVPDARLHDLLIAQLKILFNDFAPNDIRMDEDFWKQLATSSLPSAFSSLRDVKRYLGELRLTLPVFCRNGFFELNPDHFLKLQALRLFCPKIVDLIRSRRSLFLKRASGLLFSADNEKTLSAQRSTFVDEEIPAFLSKQKLPAFQLLCRELLLCYGVDMSGRALATENRFLSSRLWFDAYFTLEFPQAVVMVEEISGLREKVNESQESLSEFVRQLIAKVGEAAFVRCIETQFREEIREHGLAFLIAMLSADPTEADNNEDSDAPWDPVYDYFARWVRLTPEDQRKQRVFELLESTRNHHWFSKLLSDIERDVSYTKEITENLVAFADTFGRVTASIIEESATGGKVRLVTGFQYDLFVWEKWGSMKKLQNWIRGITSTDEGLRTFFLALGDYAMADAGGNSERECFWLNYQRLLCFPNLTGGIRRASRMGASSIDERERLLWESVVNALSYAREFRRGSRFFRLTFPGFLDARFHPQNLLQLTDDKMAVITAENPNGVTTTDSENHRRTEELAKYLANHDIPASSVPVGAADGSHVEQSFLIPVENDKAVEIGRLFQQIAVFMVFNKERVEIVSCEGKGRHQLGNLKDVVVWPPIAAKPRED